MSVIEKNVITGQVTSRAYTSEELTKSSVAAAEQRAVFAACDAKPIEEKLARLGLTVADIKAAMAR